jgi:hypothetical protein
MNRRNLIKGIVAAAVVGKPLVAIAQEAAKPAPPALKVWTETISIKVWDNVIPAGAVSDTHHWNFLRSELSEEFINALP